MNSKICFDAKDARVYTDDGRLTVKNGNNDTIGQFNDWACWFILSDTRILGE